MNKKPMHPWFISVGGGGPDIDRLVEAVLAITGIVRVVGISGASAGACIAALVAFGVPPHVIRAEIHRLLQGFKVLDPGLDGLGRGGFLRWRVIQETCDRLLGKGARMGDAKLDLVIGVTRLEGQPAPLYLTKRAHPMVLVSQAVAASSAFGAGVTPACHIESLGTELSPCRELFVDGGWTDNTVDGVWDRRKAPRAMVRLNGSYAHRPRSVEHGGHPGQIAAAVAAAALWAQSQPKSHRTDGFIVDVPRGDGWDFNKSAAQLTEAARVGRDAVKPWVARLSKG